MTYVISDVHGEKKDFIKMMIRIGFSDRDTLYVIGDVIDRGPDGIALLKSIMGSPNIHLLLGNHEYMMRSFLSLDKNKDHSRWIDAYSLWCFINGGEITYDSFLKETPDTREKILDYLMALPVSTSLEISDKKILLVHAAPPFLYTVPEPGIDNPTAFAVWHRLTPGEKLETDYELIICGHTPTMYFTDDRSSHVIRQNGIMWIDCGCTYKDNGGRLACVCLETEEIFYV